MNKLAKDMSRWSPRFYTKVSSRGMDRHLIGSGNLTQQFPYPMPYVPSQNATTVIRAIRLHLL